MLLNLSLVTRTLLTLLDRAVTSSAEWPAGTTLDASPDPPDRLTGDRTLGLYLYHVQEDPARRNQPAPGGSPLPARYTPLPLLLHYQLTSHSDLGGGQGALEEQLLMGLAMKALRDDARITDDTVVGGTAVLAPALRGQGNVLRITPRTVEPQDAVGYWTAGQHAARVAAYYEVATALLEPALAPARAPRVLSFGVHPRIGPGPRLDGSESTAVFSVPGETAARTVPLSPAEAAVGEQVLLRGADLAGDRTDVVVHHGQWDAPVTVDPAVWGVVARPDAVAFTVAADAAVDRPLLPGVYTVAVTTVTRRPGVGGAPPHEITASSNPTPFTVAPAVRAVGAPTAQGRITVTGGRFDPAALPADAVQVVVAGQRLTRRATGPTDPGEFRVDDAEHLELRLPPGLVSGEAVPLRIVVRGAESGPRWVVVP
ncbi:DUF4255 domain-containing protein [Streptomyces sp. NPDC006372]|uniref:DUF4255 domain-containing protein n=1 Tax=Streptomyces sp. NPDC006372 TaxID=3155599 RepID=UPI0033BB1703